MKVIYLIPRMFAILMRGSNVYDELQNFFALITHYYPEASSPARGTT